MNELDRLLDFDPAWRREIHGQWVRSMEIAMWGELQGQKNRAVRRLPRA